ncbi:MAG: cation:proton antiporter [Candidatus Thermoplasmatota archaeon]|nr:cation:proton antiporter [Candidatus Thermoplasmatota archaeon]
MAAFINSLLDRLLEDVWFELTFLLAVALVAAFLFTRFGQPKAIGYIVVGVFIGPSVLNIIQGGADGESGLPESIMMLAEMGAIILLFMIGLECDLKEIYTKKSIMIALGGVIVPWVAGYGTALLFGYDAEAVFIGVTLVATSVAVTASVLAELGLIGTPVAYAIVGAAVVDDILGMVVLGISKSLGSGEFDMIGIGILVVVAVLFVVLGAWIGSKFLAKLVFNVQISGYRRKMPMSGFILALAIAFMYAFIAEAIQISAIVGAFVAGTAFSGSALRDGFRKGTQYLEALFVPLFFVSLGTAVNLGSMWDTIVFGIVLTLVAFASKIIGCAIPAYYTGMKKWDAISVGVGMTPRLEIAFIIAYYGLTKDLIGVDVYSVVVFMGLATALLAPPILKRTLKLGGHKPTGI